MSFFAHRFLLLPVFILIHLSSTSCTLNSNEQAPKDSVKSEERFRELQAQIREKERYAVRLVCLKNEITSEALIEELVQIVLRTNITYNLNNMNEEEAFDAIFDATLSAVYAPIDDHELKALATKYNIPVSKLASAIYDYEIWTNSEDCRD